MSYKQEIARIYRVEGMKGFLKGYQGMFIRDTPGFAIYFGIYEYFKRCAKVSEGDKLQHNYHGISSYQVKLRLFVCGGLAGMVTWFAAYPADTLKTKLQVQKPTCTKTMSQLAQELVKEQGIIRLY